MFSQSAHTRARPRGASRAGAITSRTNSSAAWSTVASCSSSLEPKWAKRPLLLIPVASASLPIESGSRGSPGAGGGEGAALPHPGAPGEPADRERLEAFLGRERGGCVEDGLARSLALRLQH